VLFKPSENVECREDGVNCDFTGDAADGLFGYVLLDGDVIFSAAGLGDI
jgi:hypothetical protein